MTVRRDKSGRRSVQVETLVPGTPEEVWAAIATGPGISAWFCPSEVEERVGGSVRCHIGPGMETDAAVTAWDPPRRLAADSPGPRPRRASHRHRVDCGAALRRRLPRACRA